ncbi:preprotein translocase subunit SecG [Mergibacter septicus]|uniref:preprotein translocase subunit SecG n=1 Tax=Mergibacter septicus TaxID=221402 RepID=UPI0011794529|nr:preprotein translocase subunit SecG [Mergibacter septicus]AWX13670.1 preprotein translocase subunit SecG [Mergibacter septicus]
MYQVLLVIYPVIAVALIAFILVQQGKGADMGASFGSGASGTVFGASGAGNFLTRSTAILAFLFFLISLVIGNLTSHSSAPQGTFDNLMGVAQQVEKTKQETLIKKEDQNKDIPR